MTLAGKWQFHQSWDGQPYYQFEVSIDEQGRILVDSGTKSGAGFFGVAQVSGQEICMAIAQFDNPQSISTYTGSSNANLMMGGVAVGSQVKHPHARVAKGKWQAIRILEPANVTQGYHVPE